MMLRSRRKHLAEADHRSTCSSSRLTFGSLHVKVDDMSTTFYYNMVLLLAKSVVRTRMSRTSSHTTCLSNVEESGNVIKTDQSRSRESMSRLAISRSDRRE